MKQKHTFSVLVGTALLSAATLNTQAQIWDIFCPQPEISEVGGTQVLIDPFSADASNPALIIGSRIGTILRMDPLDADYQTIPLDKSLTRVCRMDFNNLTAYAAGDRPSFTTPPFPRTNPNVWTVRKSSFNSLGWSAWTDADTFYLSAKEDATAYGFTSDAAGNLYACGFANLKGWPQWIVRRKLASSESWSTIANVGSKGRATAYSVCYFPGSPSRNLQPALFVTGTLNGKWTAQRLEQNGSWTTVDSPSLLGVAHNITFDSNGNLFVAGYRDNGLDLGCGWVVRASTSGGVPGSWQPVLDVSEGYNSAAKHIAADANGNLWISGFTGTTMDMQTSQNRWTVVRKSPGIPWPDSWSARQQPFDGWCSSSAARGIATDNSGNVFITGNVSDLTDGITTLTGNRIVVERLRH